jgi:hypothetical protein
VQPEMDTLQEYEIDLVTLLEYDSRPAGESVKDDTKAGINWGAILAAVLLGGSFVWTAHYEITKLDGRIANLDKHVSKVETAVRTIGAKQGGDTKTLIVAKNASDAGRTQSAKAILDIANRLLAEQKASRLPAPQEFFDSAIQKYQTLQKSPDLADAAWEGSTKLAEYRSATSSVPSGMSVHIGEWSQQGPFRYLKDSLISGQGAVAMGTEKGFVLDGFYLDNVVFENTNIIYHGAPVILKNVRFVNCTFEVRRTPQSEKLLEAATKEPVNATIG